MTLLSHIRRLVRGLLLMAAAILGGLLLLAGGLAVSIDDWQREWRPSGWQVSSPALWVGAGDGLIGVERVSLERAPSRSIVSRRLYVWLDQEERSKQGVYFRRRYFCFSALFPLGIGLVVLAYPLFLAARVGLRNRQEERRKLQGQCRKCGYDLRALTEPRCPECGETAASGCPATSEGLERFRLDAWLAVGVNLILLWRGLILAVVGRFASVSAVREVVAENYSILLVVLALVNLIGARKPQLSRTWWGLTGLVSSGVVCLLLAFQAAIVRLGLSLKPMDLESLALCSAGALAIRLAARRPSPLQAPGGNPGGNAGPENAGDRTADRNGDAAS